MLNATMNLKKALTLAGVVVCAALIPLCALQGCSESKARGTKVAVESSADGAGEVVTVGEGVQTTKHLSPKERAKDK